METGLNFFKKLFANKSKAGTGAIGFINHYWRSPTLQYPIYEKYGKLALFCPLHKPATKKHRIFLSKARFVGIVAEAITIGQE